MRGKKREKDKIQKMCVCAIIIRLRDVTTHLNIANFESPQYCSMAVVVICERAYRI